MPLMPRALIVVATAFFWCRIVSGQTSAPAKSASKPDKEFTAEPQFSEAITATTRSDNETAYRIFSKLIAKHQDSPLAHTMLGYAAGNSGYDDEAIMEFQAAIKLNPNMDFAWYYMGDMQMRLGNFKEAEASLEKAVNLDGGNAKWWASYGMACMQNNDDAKALTALQKAVSISKDLASAWAGIGQLSAKQKKYPDAIAAMKNALQLQPNNLDYWNLISGFYMASGDGVAARDASRHAQLLKP